MVPARLIRALLTLTAFAVVWLVASPARAEGLSSVAPLQISAASAASANSLFSHDDSEPVAPAPATPEYGAPLCDRRGATTFASPPQMQETEVSLDTGMTLDDCMSGNPNANAKERALNASNGRAPLPQEIFSSSDPAVMTAIAVLARAARERLPVPDASTTCPASGVRSTVDRPPRN